MKKIILFAAILLAGYGLGISQNNSPENSEQQQLQEQPKPVVKKIEQFEKDRVVDPQNEAFLYEATSKLIRNPDYANFSIIISWYKQTKSHYYYMIGWNIDGVNYTDYMKYNWADGSVGRVSFEEIEADTDYSTPDGSKN